MATRYDLAVVGSGAAGFAAAISARRHGASVVMVEAGIVGGTCVNTGCVPSKALLAAAQVRQVAATADRFPGLAAGAGRVEFEELIAGKDALVAGMRSDRYMNLAGRYGWEIVAGVARFAHTPGGAVLEVQHDSGGVRRIEASRYLIATGSAPAVPSIDGLAEAGYLTSRTAMDLDRPPGSMVVVGGNAIGLEQAQLFARLGTRVTLVEALDRLAPFDEPEASAAIETVFADEGVTVYTGTPVTNVWRDNGQVVVALPDGQVRAEQILVATGRRPATAGLHLDQVGVATGAWGEIVVDDQLHTTNPRIWAAGDVTGAPQYVYVAARHGDVAAGNALTGAGRTVDYARLPRVTFTSPAIAAAGMTEAQAVEAGYRCDCRVVPLAYLPRAVVNRDTRGMVKLVADADTGRLLGVHAVAEAAGEVAAAGVYLLTAGMTVRQVAEMWSPYLTAAEGLKLAAQAFTRDITELSCCAA